MKIEDTVYFGYRDQDNTLDKVSSFKYLGVWITKDLSWSKHVSEVCIKAKMVIG